MAEVLAYRDIHMTAGRADMYCGDDRRAGLLGLD